MRIAILGATSQIARDLIQSFAADNEHQLILLARSPEKLTTWLNEFELNDRYEVGKPDQLARLHNIDAIINFVGSGNPTRTLSMGAPIFEVTYEFDSLALSYVLRYPSCKYIFLSSGAALGDIFSEPASDLSCAQFPLNNLEPQHWYGFAKAHAECRHRAYKEFAIVDLRIFAYCSHTQDIAARFFFTDIVRAIKHAEVLKVTSEQMIRDYITPPDFYSLIHCLLAHEPANLAIDCFSKNPVSKMDLLEALEKNYALKYEVMTDIKTINATGAKSKYYSTSKKGELFGYSPKFGSLDGILYQLNQIVSR